MTKNRLIPMSKFTKLNTGEPLPKIHSSTIVPQEDYDEAIKRRPYWFAGLIVNTTILFITSIMCAYNYIMPASQIFGSFSIIMLLVCLLCKTNDEHTISEFRKFKANQLLNKE